MLLLALLLCQVVFAKPISVEDQVMKGRLITEWGTVDSLGMDWVRDEVDDQILYIGSTLANFAKATSSGKDFPLSGDTYVILALEDEKIDEAARKALVESYVAELGTVKSKKWKPGPNPYLSYSLSNDSKGSVATVKAGANVVLIAGSGKDHSEKSYQQILKSFKSEDTKVTLAQIYSPKEATPTITPTSTPTPTPEPAQLPADGRKTPSEKIEPDLLPLGETGTPESHGGWEQQIGAFGGPWTKIFLAADTVALLVIPILIAIGNGLSKGRKMNPWWTSALLLVGVFVAFVGVIAWESRGARENALSLLSSPEFWKSVAAVNLAPTLIYMLLGARWNKNH